MYELSAKISFHWLLLLRNFIITGIIRGLYNCVSKGSSFVSRIHWNPKVIASLATCIINIKMQMSETTKRKVILGLLMGSRWNVREVRIHVWRVEVVQCGLFSSGFSKEFSGHVLLFCFSSSSKQVISDLIYIWEDLTLHDFTTKSYKNVRFIYRNVSLASRTSFNQRSTCLAGSKGSVLFSFFKLFF